jgi:hypothetical protein
MDETYEVIATASATFIVLSAPPPWGSHTRASSEAP